MADLSAAAGNGDALSLGLIQSAARVIGETLSGAVSMFNPGTVVLGGSVASAGDLFLAEVRQRIYELSLPLATRDLTVEFAVTDELDAIRGGAEFALDQLLEVTFPYWFADGKPSPEKITDASLRWSRSVTAFYMARIP